MSACIILAAGQGKRMRSELPKVVHPVLGVPMVIRVVNQAVKAGLRDPVVVVGHGREEVIPLLDSRGVSWAIQDRQMGTAHAVSCGLEGISSESVTVLLGDVPLIRSGTIAYLERSRREAGAGIAVMSTVLSDPSGYGRIIRDDNELMAIVEDRDANLQQLAVKEINTGIMSFDGTILPELLKRISNDNDQGEYYLTDAVSIARKMGVTCIAVTAEDPQEVAGVNDRLQLANATANIRMRIVNGFLLEGVDIPDPDTVWIEDAVSIGRDVTIGRFCRLSGNTGIGDRCVLGDGCILDNTTLKPGTVLPPYTVQGKP